MILDYDCLERSHLAQTMHPIVLYSHVKIGNILRAVLQKKPKTPNRRLDGRRDGHGQFIGPTFKVSRSKNRARIHLKGTENALKKLVKYLNIIIIDFQHSTMSNLPFNTPATNYKHSPLPYT